MLRAAMTAAIVLAALPGCGSDCQQDTDLRRRRRVRARRRVPRADGHRLGRHHVDDRRRAADRRASCSWGCRWRVGFITDEGRETSAFGFAPIPCVEGQFHVDKLPSGFDQIELGYDVDDDFANAEYADPNGGNPVSFALQAY